MDKQIDASIERERYTKQSHVHPEYGLGINDSGSSSNVNQFEELDQQQGGKSDLAEQHKCWIAHSGLQAAAQSQLTLASKSMRDHI